MRKYTCFCLCDKYNGVPHRVGSGKCTGSEWVASIYLLESDHCHNCSANTDGRCEVADGVESVSECEKLQDVSSRGYYPEYFHPTTIEKILNKNKSSHQ